MSCTYDWVAATDHFANTRRPTQANKDLTGPTTLTTLLALRKCNPCLWRWGLNSIGHEIAHCSLVQLVAVPVQATIA